MIRERYSLPGPSKHCPLKIYGAAVAMPTTSWEICMEVMYCFPGTWRPTEVNKK
jgi:hypothetical protein